jgi:hypothetical protein
VRHNPKDHLCQCRRCCWPPRPEGEVARAVEQLYYMELFNSGETSPAMRVLLAHAASLSRKGEQGGKGDRFKEIGPADLFKALDKHADKRMKDGERHPRPGWQTGIRKILGIKDDRALKRWMSTIGQSPDDAERYLNEKFKSR